MTTESTESAETPRIGVRELAPTDGDFLVDMVVEAVNWDGEHHTRRGVLGSPRLARYAVGWGRPGDLGLVAVDLEGPRGLQVPVGAAWLRYFASKEPGYGFVAPGVPEVSLAIVPGYRRRGIGRALLIALLARARAQGTGHVSLSVSRANPALALYQALGFSPVPDAPGTSAESVTLLLDLASVGGDPGSAQGAEGTGGTDDDGSGASASGPSDGSSTSA